MSEPACPPAEALAAFVSGDAKGDERRATETHLETCSLCVALTSELLRAQRAPAARSARPEADAARPAPTRSASAAAADATDAFGKYRLDGLLGQGAMGTVYLAFDATLERRVALKILKIRGDERPEARARLSREARAMARLSHRNVVTVYEAGDVDGRLYIAMELIDGVTLSAWLRAAERTREELLEALLQAGEGLSAAHAAGVVHRDFKPENVLVDGSGRVVVTDFGLAAAPRNLPVAAPAEAGEASVGDVHDAALTATGVVLGTPRYMSPEQYEGHDVDERSDQFSFAVTVYEAVYGRPPFQGATLQQLRRAICAGRIEPAPSTAGLSTRLHGALLRGLSREPQRRFAHLRELLAEIAACAPGPARRRSGGGFALALTVLLGLLVTAGLVVRSRIAVTPGGAGGERVAAAAPAAENDATARTGGPRTLAILRRFENRGADPRLDDVAENMLQVELACSTRFDAYAATASAGIGDEAGEPGPVREEDRAARIGARIGRHIVLVDGVLTGAGAPRGPLHLSVRTTSAAGEPKAAPLEMDVGDPGELADKMPAFATSLRRALGDDSPRDPGATSWSRSPDALHEWAVARALSFGGGESDAPAADAAEGALRADAHFGEAAVLLGSVLVRSSRFAEATERWRAFFASGDAVCERERLRAFSSYYGLLGRYAATNSALRQYLERWPGDLPAETALISNLIDERDWPVAVELARDVQRRHPLSSRAHGWLVHALFLDGKLDEALREGEPMLTEEVPPTPRVFALISQAAALLGRDAEADEALRAQAKTDPELSDEGRADLALLRGRLDEAASLLHGQIDALTAGHDASYARTELLMLAELEERRGDRAALRRAVLAALPAAAEEASLELQYELSRLLLVAGEERKARALTARWSAWNVVEARVFTKLAEGDVARAHGDSAAAIMAYRDALRVDDRWIAHARLGDALLEAGSWDEAERELSICVDRRNEGARLLDVGLHYLPPVYLALARAREGAHRPDAARTTKRPSDL